MTKATIFGDGNMGTAIAGILSEGGATVEHITTAEQGEGAVTGDLVVLAVPYPALDAIVSAYGEQLAGKVVVDITNPLDFATFDGLTVPADSSAAAVLAGKLPDARIVKAFNTTFAATLTAKSVGDRPTTVLIAGDDAEAKATLADAITAGGLAAVDAGGLQRARELEALGFLQLTLAAAGKTSWAGGFALVSGPRERPR